ncbi:hypothetical protein A7U60_g2210 [Sanghuangporus baumii]|uniref:Uncharacterized protein n=1 Tax=Sanghuangporus baumii TaxID=108892 RepID=A0A9Q5I2P9_SANBA|nr:hypothetical protein A7U60_g2210 [Sanghuangporus baumii]
MLASIAISGILAPNLLLVLRKGYYTQGQDIKLGTDISTFHATRFHAYSQGPQDSNEERLPRNFNPGSA